MVSGLRDWDQETFDPENALNGTADLLNVTIGIK